MSKHKRVFKGDKEFKLDQKLMSGVERLMSTKPDEEKMNLKLAWVVGMDVGQNKIHYLRGGKKRKANSEQIIYSVGKIIVIFLPKLNMQRYYKGHKQPVTAIEVSPSGRLVASAEGQAPADVHLWDLQTRLLIRKFRGLHQSAITILRLEEQAGILVTSSRSEREGIVSPIVVIHLKTLEIVMSTYLPLPMLGVAPHSTSPIPSFFMVSPDSVASFNQAEGAFSVQTHRLPLDQLGEIVCFAAHPLGFLTVHRKRRFCWWSPQFTHPAPVESS